MNKKSTNIPVGYKNSPLGPIPEDWEVKRLGEIGEVLMCKRIMKEQTSSHEDIPFFKIGTFGGIPDAYISKDLFEEYKSKYSFPKIGDILISAAGTIGRTVIFDGTPSYFQDSNIVWLDNDNKQLLNKYLYYYYSTINWITDTGTIPRLYNGALRAIQIPLPPLKQQQAIVSVLQLWDIAIEKQRELIEKLKLRKRGLMQQLLTGKKRLLGFEDSKFQSTPFNKIAKTISVKPFQISKSDYQDYGRIPVVDQGQVFIAAYTDTENVFIDTPFVLFGDHTRIVKWIDFSCAIGADGVQAIKSKGQIDIKFLYYLLSNTELPNLGYSRHMSILKEKVFYIPINIKMQHAIAQCLTSADKEIELANNKLSSLQAQKKGLMQQLLTGKKRINQ